MLPQNFSGFTVLFLDNGQQQMLSRVKLVLHFVGLFLSCGKDLAESRTEILLSALDARETSYRGLHIIEHNLNIDG